MPTRIIISGTIDMPPQNVAPALETARPLIEGALTEPGCLDYDWCPDPRIPGRIRVFERWESEASLAEHFKCEWYLNMRNHLGSYGITGAATAKYRVDIEEPVYDSTMTPRADFFTVKK
ncbi:MAG: antibiotic biosynthesis monooxygenase [Gammaproteobacteria bacterium]|nr:antibiotic biosynthesis monooxygenase [Gammaproteobacteria bacterium]